jgi:hypothetical protein
MLIDNQTSSCLIRLVEWRWIGHEAEERPLTQGQFRLDSFREKVDSIRTGLLMSWNCRIKINTVRILLMYFSYLLLLLSTTRNQQQENTNKQEDFLTYVYWRQYANQQNNGQKGAAARKHTKRTLNPTIKEMQCTYNEKEQKMSMSKRAGASWSSLGL